MRICYLCLNLSYRFNRILNSCGLSSQQCCTIDSFPLKYLATKGFGCFRSISLFRKWFSLFLRHKKITVGVGLTPERILCTFAGTLQSNLHRISDTIVLTKVNDIFASGNILNVVKCTVSTSYYQMMLNHTWILSLFMNSFTHFKLKIVSLY